MSLELPPALAWMANVVFGPGAWPQADPDKGFQAADNWYQLSAGFAGVADATRQAKVAVREQFDMEAADRFDEWVDGFTSGNTDYIQAAADMARSIGDINRQTAVNVDYAQLMIWVQLAQLFAQWQWAFMLSFFGIEGPLIEWGFQSLFGKAVIGRILSWVTENIVQHVVINEAMTIPMDLLIQGTEILNGKRDSIDWNTTAQSAEFGLIMGGLTGPAGIATQWLQKGVAKAVGKDFASVLKIDLNKTVNPAELGLKDTFTSELARLADKHALDLTKALQGGATSFTATDQIKKDFGKLFEDHFGETLGAGPARSLGADFGKQFAGNWPAFARNAGAGLPNDTIKTAWADSLLAKNGTAGLGTGVSEALAHHFPEAVLRTLQHPDSRALKLGKIGIEMGVSGVNGALSGGLAALWADPAHGFQMNFGAGASMAIMGPLNHILPGAEAGRAAGEATRAFLKGGVDAVRGPSAAPGPGSMPASAGSPQPAGSPPPASHAQPPATDSAGSPDLASPPRPATEPSQQSPGSVPTRIGTVGGGQAETHTDPNGSPVSRASGSADTTPQREVTPENSGPDWLAPPPVSQSNDPTSVTDASRSRVEPGGPSSPAARRDGGSSTASATGARPSREVPEQSSGRPGEKRYDGNGAAGRTATRDSGQTQEAGTGGVGSVEISRVLAGGGESASGPEGIPPEADGESGPMTPTVSADTGLVYDGYAPGESSSPSGHDSGPVPANDPTTESSGDVPGHGQAPTGPAEHGHAGEPGQGVGQGADPSGPEHMLSANADGEPQVADAESVPDFTPDPERLSRLGESLGLDDLDALKVLSQTIGRVPEDIAQLATGLEMTDPKTLFRVAHDLSADPADLVAVLPDRMARLAGRGEQAQSLEKPFADNLLWFCQTHLGAQSPQDRAAVFQLARRYEIPWSELERFTRHATSEGYGWENLRSAPRDIVLGLLRDVNLGPGAVATHPGVARAETVTVPLSGGQQGRAYTLSGADGRPAALAFVSAKRWAELQPAIGGAVPMRIREFHQVLDSGSTSKVSEPHPVGWDTTSEPVYVVVDDATNIVVTGSDGVDVKSTDRQLASTLAGQLGGGDGPIVLLGSGLRDDGLPRLLVEHLERPVWFHTNETRLTADPDGAGPRLETVIKTVGSDNAPSPGYDLGEWMRLEPQVTFVRGGDGTEGFAYILRTNGRRAGLAFLPITELAKRLPTIKDPIDTGMIEFHQTHMFSGVKHEVATPKVVWDPDSDPIFVMIGDDWNIAVAGRDGSTIQLTVKDLIAKLKHEFGHHRPEAPVVLLGNRLGLGGLERPRALADGLNRTVFAYTTDVQLVRRGPGTVLDAVTRYAGTPKTGSPRFLWGHWNRVEPRLGGYLPQDAAGPTGGDGAFVKTIDGQSIPDDKIISLTIAAESTGIQRGRAYLGLLDQATREGMIGAFKSGPLPLRHVDENGKPVQDGQPTREQTPLDPERPVFAILMHGAPGEVYLPTEYGTKTVLAPEMGLMLRRRPSIRALPKNTQVLLVICSSGAGAEGGYSVAQVVSVSIGRETIAPTNLISAARFGREHIGYGLLADGTTGERSFFVRTTPSGQSEKIIAIPWDPPAATSQLSAPAQHFGNSLSGHGELIDPVRSLPEQQHAQGDDASRAVSPVDHHPPTPDGATGAPPHIADHRSTADTGPGHDFVPPPSYVNAEDSRVPQWHQAQQNLHDTYDARLATEEEAAQALAADKGRFEEEFDSWAQEHPDLPADLLAKIRERSDEDSIRWREAATDHDGLGEELSGSFELSAVREAAMRTGRQRFESAFTAWEHRLAPEDSPLQFDLEPEVRQRIHDDMLAVFEQRLESSVDTAFATSRDIGARLESRIQQGHRRLDTMIGTLHDDLDLRAGYETAKAQWDKAFDEVVPSWKDELTEQDHVLLADLAPEHGSLSEAGVGFLREQSWQAFDESFVAVFGSTESAGHFRGDMRDALDQWSRRSHEHATEVPRRLLRQAIREAAITKSLGSVDQAAASWRESLSALGPELIGTFDLGGRDVPLHVLDQVKKALAATVDAGFQRHMDSRDEHDPAAGLGEWRKKLDELLDHGPIHAEITRLLAREPALATARRHAADDILAWSATPLSSDAGDRVRSGFEDRVAAVFDAVFDNLLDASRPLGDRLSEWRRQYQALRDDLAVHIAFEAEALPALTRAGKGFGRLSADRKIDQPTLDAIGRDYRTDWFTDYHRLWGPESLKPDAWLGHEAGHENAFHSYGDVGRGTADRPPRTGDESSRDLVQPNRILTESWSTPTPTYTVDTERWQPLRADPSGQDLAPEESAPEHTLVAHDNSASGNRLDSGRLKALGKEFGVRRDGLDNAALQSPAEDPRHNGQGAEAPSADEVLRVLADGGSVSTDPVAPPEDAVPPGNETAGPSEQPGPPAMAMQRLVDDDLMWNRTYEPGRDGHVSDGRWFKAVREWFYDDVLAVDVRVKDSRGADPEPSDKEEQRLLKEWAELEGEMKSLGKELRGFTNGRPYTKLNAAELPDAATWPGGYDAWASELGRLAGLMRALEPRITELAPELEDRGYQVNGPRDDAMSTIGFNDLHHWSDEGAFPLPDVPVVTQIPPSNCFAAAVWPVTLEDLAKVRATSAGPSGPETVSWRTDDDVLYRWDRRHPDELPPEGFVPRGKSFSQLSLRSYQLGGVEHEEGWVSTSRSDVFRPDWVGLAYRYVIQAPGGIDLAATLGRDAYPSFQEVIFAGGIRREFIVKAQRFDSRGKLLKTIDLKPAKDAADRGGDRIAELQDAAQSGSTMPSVHEPGSSGHASEVPLHPIESGEHASPSVPPVSGQGPDVAGPEPGQEMRPGAESQNSQAHVNFAGSSPDHEEIAAGGNGADFELHHGRSDSAAVLAERLSARLETSEQAAERILRERLSAAGLPSEPENVSSWFRDAVKQVATELKKPGSSQEQGRVNAAEVARELVASRPRRQDTGPEPTDASRRPTEPGEPSSLAERHGSDPVRANDPRTKPPGDVPGHERMPPGLVAHVNAAEPAPRSADHPASAGTSDSPPPYRGRPIPPGSVRDLAGKWNVKAEQIQSLLEKQWFEPSRLVELGRQLDVLDMASLVRLTESIGRIPDDIHEISKALGMPTRDVYRLICDIDIDPRYMLLFKDELKKIYSQPRNLWSNPLHDAGRMFSSIGRTRDLAKIIHLSGRTGLKPATMAEYARDVRSESGTSLVDLMKLSPPDLLRLIEERREFWSPTPPGGPAQIAERILRQQMQGDLLRSELGKVPDDWYRNALKQVTAELKQDLWIRQRPSGELLENATALARDLVLTEWPERVRKVLRSQPVDGYNALREQAAYLMGLELDGVKDNPSHQEPLDRIAFELHHDRPDSAAVLASRFSARLERPEQMADAGHLKEGDTSAGATEGVRHQEAGGSEASGSDGLTRPGEGPVDSPPSYEDPPEYESATQPVPRTGAHPGSEPDAHSQADVPGHSTDDAGTSSGSTPSLWPDRAALNARGQELGQLTGADRLEDYSSEVFSSEQVTSALQAIEGHLERLAEPERAVLVSLVHDALLATSFVPVRERHHTMLRDVRHHRWPSETTRRHDRQAVQMLTRDRLVGLLVDLDADLRSGRDPWVDGTLAGLGHSAGDPLLVRLVRLSLHNLTGESGRRLAQDPLFKDLLDSPLLTEAMFGASGHEEQRFMNTCVAASADQHLRTRVPTIAGLLQVGRTLADSVEAQLQVARDALQKIDRLSLSGRPRTVGGLLGDRVREAREEFDRIHLETMALIGSTRNGADPSQAREPLAEHVRRWARTMQKLAAVIDPDHPIPVLTRRWIRGSFIASGLASSVLAVDRPGRRLTGVSDMYARTLGEQLRDRALDPTAELGLSLRDDAGREAFWEQVHEAGGVLVAVPGHQVFVQAIRRDEERLFAIADPTHVRHDYLDLPAMAHWASKRDARVSASYLPARTSAFHRDPRVLGQQSVDQARAGVETGAATEHQQAVPTSSQDAGTTAHPGALPDAGHTLDGGSLTDSGGMDRARHRLGKLPEDRYEQVMGDARTIVAGLGGQVLPDGDAGGLFSSVDRIRVLVAAEIARSGYPAGVELARSLVADPADRRAVFGGQGSHLPGDGAIVVDGHSLGPAEAAQRVRDSVEWTPGELAVLA
ncbi:MAG TPA: hypothetical protein VGP70_23785, partial [Actinomadura sp.]|nr:hypothetical protein [Actinomadura sp.]